MGSGLVNWRERNANSDCTFLCELGPPEYAMTESHGYEMSNRWEEALQVKSSVTDFWTDLERC